LIVSFGPEGAGPVPGSNRHHGIPTTVLSEAGDLLVSCVEEELWGNEGAGAAISGLVIAWSFPSSEQYALLADGSTTSGHQWRTWGSSPLALLTATGLPVTVLVRNDDDPCRLATAAGKTPGARYACEPGSGEAPSGAIDSRVLEVEERFAPSYDDEELAAPGTVVAILAENDYLVESIRRVTADRPLEILDVGCGTGRFPEILLSDDEIGMRITRIETIDVAPRYLELAKERLRAVLPPKRFRLVTYSRRCAESTQFDSESFDVAVLGFGVLSFTQPAIVLREVYRVLRPGGMVFVTVYNRLSHLLERGPRSAVQSGSDLLIDLDVERGVLHLGDSTLPCVAFSPSGLCETLHAAGFHVEDSPRTFPSIFGAVGETETRRPQEARNGPVRYTSHALLAERRVDPRLLAVDRQARELSGLRDRGAYVSVVGLKGRR
jgi:ubiquinone/menaquinone biosynthesis C-methylase UbiE